MKNKKAQESSSHNTLLEVILGLALAVILVVIILNSKTAAASIFGILGIKSSSSDQIQLQFQGPFETTISDDELKEKLSVDGYWASVLDKKEMPIQEGKLYVFRAWVDNIKKADKCKFFLVYKEPVPDTATTIFDCYRKEEFRITLNKNIEKIRMRAYEEGVVVANNPDKYLNQLEVRLSYS